MSEENETNDKKRKHEGDGGAGEEEVNGTEAAEVTQDKDTGADADNDLSNAAPPAKLIKTDHPNETNGNEVKTTTTTTTTEIEEATRTTTEEVTTVSTNEPETKEELTAAATATATETVSETTTEANTETNEPPTTAAELEQATAAPTTQESVTVVPSGVPSAIAGVPIGVPIGVPGVSQQTTPATTTTASTNTASTITTPQPQATTTISTVEPEGTIIEKSEVALQYVGRVIGKGGEQIRDLQARSGCKIDVDQNVPAGAPRVITYQGTRKTIDFAKHLVGILCSDGWKDAELPLGEASKKKLQVPATAIGKIIGRGGEMIKELQSKSQAKIQIDHSGAGAIDQSMRLVTLIGTEESVVKAEEMITFLISNPAADAMNAIAMLIREKSQGISAWGSGPPYSTLPNNGQGMNDLSTSNGGGGYGGYGKSSQLSSYGAYGSGYGGGGGGNSNAYGQQLQQSHGRYGYEGVGGGTEIEIFPCSKMYMGRVIGQKGVTINDLQKKSQCDIQINQDVPPGQDCEITIKGTRQGIESVKKMLTDIIQMGPNHPYAGGGGSGGRQQGGYGQQTNSYLHAQQQQQQQGYYSQPQPNYIQQPQYGVPAQQQYAPLQPQYQPQQPYGYHQQQQQQPPQQYGQQQPYGYQQPVPITVPGHMASPWKAATAPDGQTYYYNEKTGATTWEKPAGMM